jgi:hypothetical protein
MAPSKRDQASKGSKTTNLGIKIAHFDFNTANFAVEAINFAVEVITVMAEVITVMAEAIKFAVEVITVMDEAIKFVVEVINVHGRGHQVGGRSHQRSWPRPSGSLSRRRFSMPRHSNLNTYIPNLSPPPSGHS